MVQVVLSKLVWLGYGQGKCLLSSGRGGGAGLPLGIGGTPVSLDGALNRVSKIKRAGFSSYEMVEELYLAPHPQHQVPHQQAEFEKSAFAHHPLRHIA